MLRRRGASCFVAVTTAVAILSAPESVSGFVVAAPPTRILPPVGADTLPTRRSSSALNCICINCKWVTTCAAYHFVEDKHEQPHMTDNPTFEPRDGEPKIAVNIRNIRSQVDRAKEVERMWREHKLETEKAEEAADGAKDGLVGEEQYDFSPAITYEYDVIECADFQEDPGAWVRNMPEEIRKANPDFVPS